jgi:hypothetical protein
MISQHRPNPQINHKCTLCKQLKTTAVAKKMRTVYSNAPPSHGLSLRQSTILPLSVSQAVAGCQTAAVVCHATILPHTRLSLCRGLAVSLTLLCRMSISTYTTTRSAKGQAGPSVGLLYTVVVL